MNIEFTDIGKKYSKRWIFRHLDGKIKSGQITGISGNNGSGKSTLLKILIGFVPPSEGKLKYVNNDGTSSKVENIYKHIAFSAPYVDLIESFTIRELYDSYFSFKRPIADIDYAHFISESKFENHQRKTISTFSSGMKQRLNIMFALTSEVPVVIFDEPTSFLDDDTKEWFFGMLNHYHLNRTVIIASNEKSDLEVAQTVYALI